jgi:lysophospholipase L1-like esterase
MLNGKRLVALTLVFAISQGALAQVVLEPGQLEPIRLFSIGDSLTTAANANLPGDNPSSSWVNGYRRTTQKLLGLPDVNSHNQRIDYYFGKSGRTNASGAFWGARVDDFVKQTKTVLLRSPTYATVMLGGNDLCRDDPATLPTNEEFEHHVREGLTALTRLMPDGSTALVVAIPNARLLYDLGLQKTALGITSCRTMWKLTGFCEALLNENRSEADRAYIQQRNVEYNAILERVTTDSAAANAGRKFVRFAPRAYELPYAENQISDIDCFHTAWRGQRALSDLTWPFSPKPAALLSAPDAAAASPAQ